MTLSYLHALGSGVAPVHYRLSFEEGPPEEALRERFARGEIDEDELTAQMAARSTSREG